MGTLTISNTYCGAMTNVYYGALYNLYAVIDAKKISSSDDWVVPTKTQIRALADALGASGNYTSNSAGGKMKETGLTYWNTPNTGADNSSGFNARAAGYRQDNGNFANFKVNMRMWSSTQTFSDYHWYLLSNADASLYESFNPLKYGHTVRFMYVGAGTPTMYVGNDGKAYRVVTIGSQIWLADNLCETKFRDTTNIPNVTDTSAWAALTSSGVCAYDNDVTKVAEGFTFPS